MAYLSKHIFSFRSSGLPAETFEVERFRGSEGLSRCYSFEVMLVSGNPEVELENVIRHPATLTFHRQEGHDVHYNGILLDFEQLHAFGEITFYRAHLVPRLQWLALTQHNQVFLNKTVPEFITDCLKDGGLSALDFEFRLMKSHEPLEYVCQYGESHLNFINRWLEREGMYYFFEQSENAEKVIFTDSRIAHTAMPHGKAVRYTPVSGLEMHHRQEIVSQFTCRYKLTPASVLVKDYNYLKPSLEVSGTAKVDDQGRGVVYSYGDHISTPEEGKRVAKVFAESVLCRREMYYGEGSVPYVCPGFVFNLEDHYRRSFNRGYLTLDVDHEGSQTGYLLAGLTLEEDKREVFYRNSFGAIPDSVQFRSERATPRPRISGCISAKVDASGSGQYAELDEHGRYKVILPFDTSGRKDGKASAWVRMAQPYAGSDHGMHFPLHKGTEVLLTFMDGDPDRPIIQGAVPNPEMPSQVTSADQTMSKITTAGGNKIHMEDQQGSERILMHVPKQQSFVRMGAVNDPPSAAAGDGGFFSESDGIAITTDKRFAVKAGLANTLIIGENGSWTLINDNKFVGGIRTDTTIGLRIDTKIGGSVVFDTWHKLLNAKKDAAVGQANHAIGSQNIVLGSNATAAASTSLVAASNNNVSTSHNNVIATHTNTSGASTSTSGQNTQLSGSSNNTTGASTTVNASNSTVSASIVQASTNNTITTVSNTNVSTNQTTTTVNNTNTSAVHNITAATVSIV